VHPLLKKLNFKDHGALHVVNLPAPLQSLRQEFAAHCKTSTSSTVPAGTGFVIAFATKQSEVDRFATQVASKTVDDAVVWVAYPKGTSRNYTCEFNRDNGWAAFGAIGFEPVRQVAIDDDWSALRLRRVGHIKTMTRKSAVSKQGQARIKAPAAPRKRK